MAIKTWQLQEAKAHFSEVVKNAMSDGPQNITLRGASVVVIISKTEYDALLKPRPSFVQFMRRSPLVGIKLNMKRNTSYTRDIEL